jgi:hypothetical protein
MHMAMFVLLRRLVPVRLRSLDDGVRQQRSKEKVLDDRQFTKHFRFVHLDHPAVYFGPLLDLVVGARWVRTARVQRKVKKGTHSRDIVQHRTMPTQ